MGRADRYVILFNMAADYYKYIVSTHCTIEEAATHFKVPKTTLYTHLKRVPEAQQVVLKRICRENKRQQQRDMRNKRLKACKAKRKSEYTPTLRGLALKYSAYIVKTHCTITDAAVYFNVPRSTLWWRLDTFLRGADRAPSKEVANENQHRRKKICS